MSRFGPEMIAEMAAKRERRERIATAVYVAFFPIPQKKVPLIPGPDGSFQPDYRSFAAAAIAAADAFIVVLDADREKP